MNKKSSLIVIAAIFLVTATIVSSCGTATAPANKVTIKGASK